MSGQSKCRENQRDCSMLFQGVKLDSYCIIFDRMKNQTGISEMEGRGRMEVRVHIYQLAADLQPQVVYGLLYVYRRKAIRVVTRKGKGYFEEREWSRRCMRVQYMV
ncbi:hypothetical protein H112_04769 [Trichophyton rubrum D6]|uniref:Uncharacterized protein n=1 Tax=Trichophyton soudanense CBS 452.61 TaxID=1215331 RepID=A0A022XSK9_TRISD|nr:hypothetical protein H100_04778 [Trichophyton rubrum MR850]EZF41463.1 hypothetical protein H102_04765 [Trichophyton rubrum CBS 100081]EZF62694.1 hypothetical protein H104_04756 [Trichophyton rubrum CBS 289.86]EZF73318.1 hypothetical protein H105_04787 [Trichophyton soudanense CBS 452.61]EZF83942.1 hypothetical protein H110_04766 [Trichophyton rubrum MR1448]EZF94840.1 hypothetical protein H113_04806 [Trichophyton rubrum MR1459]EZG16248.1 hypothetical protein H107_04896 [Trichophyton rubrum 